MDCLKVSSKSSPASVAGAIAGMVKDGVPVINGESRTAIRLSIYVHQINRAAMDNVVMDDVKPVA